jgi:membrane-associated phospholipid phosphatase
MSRPARRHLAARQRQASSSGAAAVAELSLGLVLLAAAALAGALFVRRPWENRLDVWAYSLVPERLTWRGYLDVAELGSTAVFAAGIAVLALVSAFRDLARAIACVVGPVCAVVVTERVAKPLVARHGVLGGDSYPSGTVTAVAALAVVLVLVSPWVIRPLTGVIGAVAVFAVSVAVIGLRWHFATDTVGGALVGSGAVLTVDALAHLPGIAWRQLGEARRSRGRARDTSGRPSYDGLAA